MTLNKYIHKPAQRVVEATSCKICGKSLLENIGCKYSSFISRNKREFLPVKYGDEKLTYNSFNCPDCGCSMGHYHHHNCDVEECPMCHKPLRFCKNCSAARFYEQDVCEEMSDGDGYCAICEE